MLTRALVALALVLSACTSPGRDVPEPPLPISLGDCEGPTPGPDPDYAAALAVPGEWVRIEGERPPGLPMPDSTARAIDRALDSGATVHAHTRADGQVAYAVAEHEGKHVFLGDCATALFTDPLRHKYGADYDRVVAGLIGKTPGFVARALQGDPEYAVYLVGDRYTRRGSAPHGLSIVQRNGGFLVRGARAWDPGVALCLVTALGVGGCARRSGDLVVTRTGLTWDPLIPVVEIALYERPSERLIVVLATVDVAKEARAAGFDPETDGVMLYADLPASPTLTEVAADPALAPRAVKVTVTPCRSAYCR